MTDASGQSIRGRRFTWPEWSGKTTEALAGQYIVGDPLIRVAGIGMPGAVADGVVESCDIKALEKVNFAQLLGKRSQIDVIVKND